MKNDKLIKSDNEIKKELYDNAINAINYYVAYCSSENVKKGNDDYALLEKHNFKNDIRDMSFFTSDIDGETLAIDITLDQLIKKNEKFIKCCYDNESSHKLLKKLKNQ